MTTTVPRRAHSGISWDTVFLGDWTRTIRDWADVIRLAYVAGAGYAFATGAYGHGVRMIMTFAAASTARLLKAPRLFDFFFTLTIGLQAWGNLAGLFHNGDAFDRLDHAMSIFGLVPLFYLWFVHLGLLRHTGDREPTSHQVGLVVVGVSIGLAIGSLYEIYEYISVHALGSHVYISENDTVMDLSMDAIGALAGSCLLLAWVLWGWGTERRVGRGPGVAHPHQARPGLT
jgi:hypothetical protein